MPSNTEMNRVFRAHTIRTPSASDGTREAAPHSRSGFGYTRALIGTVGAIVSTVLLSGCQLIVNPFKDELAGQQAMTTASVEGARAAKTTPSVRQRDYPPVELRAEADGVTHGPLYFEDPFEDKGSEDGRFAWTGEDYLQLFYWRGRFLLNTVLFPISAVVTPPWMVMESDGRLSRQALGCDHDAERWVEPAVDKPTEAVSAGG